MSFFDLDPQADANIMDRARATGVKPSQIGADMFQGAGTGLLNGLKTAYNRDLFNVAAPDDAALRKQAIDRIDELKPNPQTVGAAGQLLHGMGDQLGTLYLNFMGGNVTPQTMAMASADSYAKSQKEIHIKEGLDPATAESVARLEGAGLGLGAVVPGGVAGNLAVRAASGAGVNLLMGAGQRGLTQHILNEAGYTDMARQYAPFDGTSVATDLLIGGLFGGMLGERAKAKGVVRDEPRVNPTDLDTGLAMNNAAHVELGTAPGIPTDFETRQAHVEAVTGALQSLIRGEPVTTDMAVANGNFMENPAAVKTRETVRTVVEDHLGPEWKVFEAQLRERGLPLDDIDQSGVVKVVKDETPSLSSETKAAESGTEPAKTETAAPLTQGERQAGPTDTIGRILNERTDMTIPSGDGQTLPAHEALAQSDAEIASAKQDAQGFEAAVACALRG